MSQKIRVLFIGEGATLAHVVRPLQLARGLDSEVFEVAFARPASYGWIPGQESLALIDLHSQDSEVFARRLATGLPLYTEDTLRRYVVEDLALLDSFKPDVVIGDFRLSLSVSARLRAVPFITICDAYWSSQAAFSPSLPVLPITRVMPLPLAQLIFRGVYGWVCGLHARPLNRVRQEFGLQAKEPTLSSSYTDADMRLFANFPLLFPNVPNDGGGAFLGPVTWSPPDEESLDPLLKPDKPIAYVTMGSSGDIRALSVLLPLLAQEGYVSLVATAGKTLPANIDRKRTHVFDYLPGNQICKRADLVVCNGGSPTTNQALTSGVPVIGIAQNMDQFLNMRAIEDYGAGVLVRGDRASEANIRTAIRRARDESHVQQARVLQDSALRCNPSLILTQAIRALLHQRTDP